MKNKTIAILLLATTISISGCGGCSKNETSTEPTEVVMETESIIETEEPTETEEIAVETETEEPIDIYSDEVIGTLAMYDFFEGSTADEIRQFVKDHDDIQEILNTHDSEYIDSWIPEFKDFYGGTLYELNHPATNNSSTSNKGNSSSTSNNTGNTAGSQSNTNSSNTESGSGNITIPPADTSSDQGMDDMTKAALEAAGGDILDSSNFGNGPSTNYGNAIY